MNREPSRYARVALAMTVSLVGLLLAAHPIPCNAHPFNIAHRGGTVAGPENTLVNFQLGIDAGADWIEMDIWRSSDGVFVIHHDPTLYRTTNGTGYIYDHTFAELRALDVGSWFSPEFTGEQMPSLEEALNLITPQAIAFIEIKKPEYIPGVAALITQLNIPADRVISWIRLGRNMAADYHQYFPNGRVVYEINNWESAEEELIWERAEAGDYGVAVEYETLTSEFVDLVHSYGLTAQSYKVLSPSYQQVIDTGVDGLVVAAPASLNPLLPGPQPECSDGLDNDSDGLTDFPDDTSCFGPEGPVESTACSDGIDNDSDGATDFPNDTGCYARFSLNENPECSDGIDNDGTGHFDYPDDPSCFEPFDSREAAECIDGIDNDRDGLTDWRFDPGCYGVLGSTESPQCDDGKDNDGDGFIDFGSDVGCDTPYSDSENPACADGIDNDADGFTDHPDDEACASRGDLSEIPDCQDGFDNDFDGKIDWPEDPQCRAALDHSELARVPALGGAAAAALASALLGAGIVGLRARRNPLRQAADDRI